MSPTRRLVWQTLVSCHTPLTSLWSPSSLTTPVLTSSMRVAAQARPLPCPTALNIDGAVREGWSLSPTMVWPLPIASLFSGCNLSPFNFFQFCDLYLCYCCGYLNVVEWSCLQKVLLSVRRHIKSQEMRVISVSAVASCAAVRRDFLEMTLCVYLIPVFASLSMCGAFMLCIMTLTTEHDYMKGSGRRHKTAILSFLECVCVCVWCVHVCSSTAA